MMRTILIMVVILLAGYFGYNWYAAGGDKKSPDTQGVHDSFKALTTAIQNGDIAAIEKRVAPNFSDKEISRADFIKVLELKRKVFKTALGKNIKIVGNTAFVDYKRIEQRAEGPQIESKVKNENWVRDPGPSGGWKLLKLAGSDKWMRSFESPEPVGSEDGKESESPLAKSQELAAQMVAMKKGQKYNSVGKRDPFRALVDITNRGGPEAGICEPERPRTMLEGFALGSMQLAGVIGKNNSYVALMETPDGKGYSVSEGMYLGKNCGLVTTIRDEFIDIREKIRKPGAKQGVFNDALRRIELRP